MYWFIVVDVWYAVTQIKAGTILLQLSMSTDLQISNVTGTYGSH